MNANVAAIVGEATSGGRVRRSPVRGGRFDVAGDRVPENRVTTRARASTWRSTGARPSSRDNGSSRAPNHVATQFEGTSPNPLARLPARGILPTLTSASPAPSKAAAVW